MEEQSKPQPQPGPSGVQTPQPQPDPSDVQMSQPQPDPSGVQTPQPQPDPSGVQTPQPSLMEQFINSLHNAPASKDEARSFLLKRRQTRKKLQKQKKDLQEKMRILSMKLKTLEGSIVLETNAITSLETFVAGAQSQEF